ncbi:hotdog fold thioesterase [Maritimibacter sp. DP07]|uniref:Hotdog fold thioesterase n=1 Tax=Maritimibacter harenae TaxID=2606218 RepID=A0A845M9L1_9RHOB|nr:PaaI family thioesterase [Maritimibacter harenae]MZR14777.1 hotdog fold thioesterase [Maritimibacter harenae]
MTFAERPEDLTTPEEALSMSGLEYMERMLAGELAGPPIGRVLDYAATHVEHGKVIFRGTPRFDFCNPMGTVHGGWYGTLLDSAMACAVMTTVPKGSTYTTLEYKVNIVRSIPLGMEVETIGTVQHGGRSTGVAVGEIRGVEDGKLYATGSTTCIVMRIAPPA